MSFGLLVRQPAPWLPAHSCPPPRSRRRAGPTTGRGLCRSRWPPPSSDLAHGQEQDLPGSLATHPVTLRRSTTPDDPSRLAARGAAGAAPRLTALKASSLQLSRLTATLRNLLSTLHDARCRAPCKTRFRLAGCAFAGRESNPLGSVGRFQIISSPFPGLRLKLGHSSMPIDRFEIRRPLSPESVAQLARDLCHGHQPPAAPARMLRARGRSRAATAGRVGAAARREDRAPPRVPARIARRPPSPDPRGAPNPGGSASIGATLHRPGARAWRPAPRDSAGPRLAPVQGFIPAASVQRSDSLDPVGGENCDQDARARSSASLNRTLRPPGNSISRPAVSKSSLQKSSGWKSTRALSSFHNPRGIPHDRAVLRLGTDMLQVAELGARKP